MRAIMMYIPISVSISPKKIESLDIPGCSLELFLEFLELFLGGFATCSNLLRELFCLGLLHFVQLSQLFFTRWHTNTSLRIWLVLFSFIPS